MQALLDTSDFPPRWHCGQWTDLHGWTHITADVATFLAYFTIPIAILFYLRRKPQLEFRGLYLLFAAFILSCGTVHLIEASIFWLPWYRLSALAKVVMALVSWGTVIAIIRYLPAAMKLPELASVNASLKQEVDERERAQALLRRRNEELDEFAYIASHDLKAPLRTVKTLARWAMEDSGETLNDAGRDHLQALQNRVHHMERLLKDMIEYSRIGREHAEVEELQAGAVVAAVLELIDVPPGFDVRVEGELPELRTARSLLEQVFMNLLTNAIGHHDRPSGTIRIGGETEGEFVRFFVEDDGPGIPEEARDRSFLIFKSMHQGAGESTGVGLALVRKLVATFGGNIWMESAQHAEPGRGLRVCFTWPLNVRVNQPLVELVA